MEKKYTAGVNSDSLMDGLIEIALLSAEFHDLSRNYFATFADKIPHDGSVKDHLKIKNALGEQSDASPPIKILETLLVNHSIENHLIENKNQYGKYTILDHDENPSFFWKEMERIENEVLADFGFSDSGTKMLRDRYKTSPTYERLKERLKKAKTSDDTIYKSMIHDEMYNSYIFFIEGDSTDWAKAWDEKNTIGTKIDGINFKQIDFLIKKLDPVEKLLGGNIDGILDDVKAERIGKVEANFYERTLARTDVDIFFLADNTGSMGGVIASVRKNAQAILDGLRKDIDKDPRFATGSKKVNARFGVGLYQDDPREPSTGASVSASHWQDSSYWLHQAMTDDEQKVIEAIDKWQAYGGNGYIEEGNFYAIHQVITEGEAVRGDDSLKNGYKTGWRKDAAKVIVVFGDRMSWQNSVNEKELKELVRATGAKIIFIDTHEMNDSTSRASAYDSHNGSQMKDAAVEIADASGGVYMKLTDLDKMKEAVVDSVFDALADNTWQGGMLARLGSGADQQWRVRTPSSVTATSEDEGKTLNIALRSPGQPTSGFTVNTTASTRVQGTGYYAGKITDFGYSVTNADGSIEANYGIFGKDYSAGDSVFHTNADNSFMRFILSDGAGGVVEGYYGERLSNAAKLPSSAIKTISSYDMRHLVINPNGSRDSSAAEAMKLFINWTGEDVYGIETHANLAGGTGTALFIGKVDRSRTELTGQYAFKTRETSGSPLVIRDAARDTTTLQIYGKNGAAGLGGTFGTVFEGSGFGSSSLSSMTMSGFRNQAAVSTTAPVPGDVWKGFAAGWVKSGGSVQSAYSSNPNEVQITFSESSNSVATNVNMRMEDGTGALVGFANDWLNDVNGSNVYLNKDAFVAVKDMNGTPSFVAAAGDDGYDYQTWGVWSVESAHSGLASATVLDGSYWIAGAMTSIADMQLKTGTATYNGHVHGTAREGGALHALDGTSKLTANFDSGTIGGHLNINYVNGGAYATSDLSSVSIIQNGGQNTNRFAGSLGGADNVGNIQGAFYGPDAAEVGGNWSINKNNGASHATGIFAGKQ